MCSHSWPSAGLSVDNDADNNSIESDGWSEDDHDEHADECCTVLRSDKSCGGTKDADANTAEDIRETNSDSDPEGSVAGVLRNLVGFFAHVDVGPCTAGFFLLTDKQGDDEAVDATSLAKNDTDEVLWLDARHLHHRAQDWRWGDHDTPINLAT